MNEGNVNKLKDSKTHIGNLVVTWKAELPKGVKWFVDGVQYTGDFVQCQHVDSKVKQTA